MFPYPSEEIELTAEDRRVLKQTESGPGTVLHDFDALLTYIKERDLPVTRTGQLPLRTLAQINARLAHPIELGLQRPKQKSYPHIQGLYLLARASGLTYIDMAGNEPYLRVDDQVHQAWQRLNPTERYGDLLEAWLLRGRPEIVGERGSRLGRVPENFNQSQFFLLRIPDNGLQVAGNRRAEHEVKYWPGFHNLGLLDLFGLIEVQRAAPEPGQGWRIERIMRTPFGVALVLLLWTGFFADFDKVEELEEQEEIPYGVFQPALQPYFPAWRNNLALPQWSPREGAHVFRVSLGQTWRRIATPADSTLDDLASAILDAFRFDQDHLYEFAYQDRSGAAQQVHHPDMDEGPWTSEVAVGAVPLGIGQTMIFVFDFGDWWEFGVTLEGVDPDRHIDKPTILQRHGKSPKQYRSWNEDE